MTLYQIDAFTDHVFGGNPAGVIFHDVWPQEQIMQAIAMENNLAETAFIVPHGDDFQIRWYTPTVEVELCGHATLAAAFVLFNEMHDPRQVVRFVSKSGWLSVTRNDPWLILDFPVDKPRPIEVTKQMQACSSASILEAYEGRSDYLFVLADEAAVRESHFDLDAIRKIGRRGVIVTAEGKDVDFVSRFFAPSYGIDEDPVTGSAHTTLTPYWSMRLGKNSMSARQVSTRGGYLLCELKADRVFISGKAVKYMEGEVYIV